MKSMIAALTLWSIGAVCAGCGGGHGESGAATNRVADQRLAAYAPLRRITYRDACGSSGPLTVCVQRVSLSDTAALVETRIANASPLPCRLDPAARTGVVLENGAGQALGGDTGQGVRLEPGERTMHFRIGGAFTGEPAMFRVQALGDTPPAKSFSVAVRLGP